MKRIDQNEEEGRTGVSMGGERKEKVGEKKERCRAERSRDSPWQVWGLYLSEPRQAPCGGRRSGKEHVSGIIRLLDTKPSLSVFSVTPRGEPLLG